MLFILLLVMGASTLLVSKLNKAATKVYWEDYTSKRLMEAKTALLGRSASDKNRPGSLPCPDTDGDGTAELFAGDQCPSYIGFFPWKTLDVEELKDGTNSPLWYALQPTLRDHSSAEPINSETAGTLTLDNGSGTGSTDLVAVIIAPGEALPSQDRASNPNLINHYLEDDNADGDQDFVTKGATNQFNDTVLAITRQELMTVVEKRVLGEVVIALKEYNNLYGGYPWLSAFQDPLTSNFTGSLGVREGHLPVHRQNQVFATTFSVDWNITGGSNPVPQGNVTEDILNGVGIGAIVFDQPSTVYGSTTGSPECIWNTKSSVKCKGAATESFPGGFQRTYDISIEFENGTVSINPPDLSKLRTRDVSNTFGPLSNTTVKITITDDSSGLLETGTNVLGNNSTGLFVVGGIAFDLDPNLDPAIGRAEIPAWFTNNNWHRLIYVAYSGSDTPGSGTSCDTVPNCITLRNTVPEGNKRGIVLSAGSDLTGNRAADPGNWYNYFEDSVHTLPPAGNDIFEKKEITNNYNDQVQILDTSP